MKINDVILETKRSKPLDAHSKVSPGSAFTTDGYIDLYRATGLMARCPAESDDIDPYSYVTRRPMIVTYTPEEEQIVKDAFKRMGIDYNQEMSRGSEEPNAVNIKSPTQGFKGY